MGIGARIIFQLYVMTLLREQTPQRDLNDLTRTFGVRIVGLKIDEDVF